MAGFTPVLLGLLNWVRNAELQWGDTSSCPITFISLPEAGTIFR